MCQDGTRPTKCRDGITDPGRQSTLNTRRSKKCPFEVIQSRHADLKQKRRHRRNSAATKQQCWPVENRYLPNSTRLTREDGSQPRRGRAIDEQMTGIKYNKDCNRDNLCRTLSCENGSQTRTTDRDTQTRCLSQNRKEKQKTRRSLDEGPTPSDSPWKASTHMRHEMSNKDEQKQH